MSLKERLKGSWKEVKKDWKESSDRKRNLAETERSSYYEEKKKQAGKIGRARARIETKNRLKEMRTPRSIGMQSSPLFSGGMFGEPVGLRRAKHKKAKAVGSKGVNIYVNGKKSKPSHRRKRVHKTKGFGLFDERYF